MSELESKKEEKGKTPGESAEVDVTSDIESALNFLDFEELQEDREPAPHTSPISPGIEPVQSPQPKDSTTTTTRVEKVARPRKIEKEPVKRASVPLERTQDKKSGKIWPLCLAAGILIFFAILTFFKMGT